MICLIRSNGDCLDVSSYDVQVMIDTVKDLLSCRDYPSVNDFETALMAVTRSYLRGRGHRVSFCLTAALAGELVRSELTRSSAAGEPDRWARWLRLVLKGKTARSPQPGPRVEHIDEAVDGFEGTAYEISATTKLMVGRGGLSPGSAALISRPVTLFEDLDELTRYIVGLWEAASHAMSAPGPPQENFVQSKHAGEAIRELEREFKESLGGRQGDPPS